MTLKFNAGVTTNTATDTEEKKFSHLPKDTVIDVVVERCSLKTLDKSLEWNKRKSWDEEVNFAFKPVDDQIRKDCGWFFTDVPAILDNSSNCKLRLYIQSILGIDDLAAVFPDGFEFEPNDYIGQYCQIRVGTYFSKKKQEIQNSVEDVTPASSSGTQPTADVVF
jgi:hypothetical protein